MTITYDTINVQINHALAFFHVSMTHMGEISYLCKNDIHTIASHYHI